MRVIVLLLVVAVVVGCGKKADVAVAPPQDDPQPAVARQPRQPPVKKVDPKPLSEATIMTWKEAGAYTGWMGLNANELMMISNDMADVRDPVPGFGFDFQKYSFQPANLTLPKVPAVQTPFGVSFGSVRGWNDEGMAQLTALKTLSSLDLHNTRISDAGLKHLAELKGLEYLDVSDTDVTDAGLKALAGLTNLKFLRLPSKVTDAGLKELTGHINLTHLNACMTGTTDAGLTHLTGLKNLAYLDVAYTMVTDAGLKHIAGSTNLETLVLSRTKVTDAGLKQLAGLQDLKKLYLDRTNVSDAGAAELQKALPDCKIVR